MVEVESLDRDFSELVFEKLVEPRCTRIVLMAELSLFAFCSE